MFELIIKWNLKKSTKFFVYMAVKLFCTLHKSAVADNHWTLDIYDD